MATKEQHLARLMESRRGTIYSGDHAYRVDVLEYDEDEDRVKIRFDSTRRIDWYPRTWVYARPAV